MGLEANAMSIALQRCLADGGGSEAVVEMLSREVRCSVAIEELGHVRCSCVHERDTDASKRALATLNGLSLKGSRTFSHATDFYGSKHHAFPLTDRIAGVEVNRIAAPIISGGRKLGYLSFVRIDHSFTEDEIAVADAAATLLGISMQEARRTDEFRSKLLTSFIDDLVTGTYRTASPALDYSRELGHDLSTDNRLIVVDIDEAGMERTYPLGASSIDDWKLSLVGTARKSSGEDTKAIVVFRNMQLVIIAAVDRRDDDGAQRLARSVLAALEAQLPDLSFMVGIGSLCRCIDDIRPSFNAAQRVIQLGRDLGGERRIFSLEQFGTRALLYSALDADSLISFVSDRLGELVRYDEEAQAELIETLQAFLDNRGNAHKTAADMNLSSSGLKYRLKKIEELTHQDLRDSRMFYDLVIAMDILNLVGRDQLLLDRPEPV